MKFWVKYNLGEALVWLAIFSLPWQTRWIFAEQPVVGQPTEYGALSVYGSAILALVAAIILNWQKRLQVGRVLFLLLIPSWLIVSAGWVLVPNITIYFAGLFFVAWLFLVIAQCVSQRIIINALISSALVQAFFAIGQFMLQHISANKWLGLASHSPEVLGQSVIMSEGVRMLRAYGSLPHPNILAGFLAIVLVMLIWFSLTQKLTEFKKTTLLVAAALMFTALILTFSRAGLFVLLGTLLLMAVRLLMTKQWFLLQSWFGYIIVFLAIISFLSFTISSSLVSRLNTNSRLETISTEQRARGLSDYSEIINMKNIWFGIGVGNYVYQVAESWPEREAFDYQPVHNSYLVLIIELGIIFSIIFLILVRLLFKGHQDFFKLLLLAPILLLAFFDHWLVTSYFGLALTAVIIALVAKKQNI